MKKMICWLIVAGIGFVVMLFSYFCYQHDPGVGPWKEGVVYVGKTEPNAPLDQVQYVEKPIRFLPVPQQAAAFGVIARNYGQNIEKSYRATFQEKVISYPEAANDLGNAALAWGRFPGPDAGEIVAGYYAHAEDEITIEERTFKIVGRLKKHIRLLSDAYLICDEATAAELFDPEDEAVHNAYIIQARHKRLTDRQVRTQLADAFPTSEFFGYAPMVRTSRGPYYLYLTGIALLLLGGSVAICKFYAFLAPRISNSWLRPPLEATVRYKHLLLALHLSYFGLVVLVMSITYLMPELQLSLLAGIKSQVSEGSGPLGFVGKAYLSKNVLRAAVATFAVNFPIGSLLSITLPSVILPGAGVLVAGFRAMMWGLLLAPTFVDLSGGMLPHSFTLLLEGEGYILALFFALLIPVYLFRKSEGPTVVRRYGRALLMNIRGNLLVAIVLAIAAIYEAIEVILAMM